MFGGRGEVAGARRGLGSCHLRGFCEPGAGAASVICHPCLTCAPVSALSPSGSFWECTPSRRPEGASGQPEVCLFRKTFCEKKQEEAGYFPCGLLFALAGRGERGGPGTHPAVQSGWGGAGSAVGRLVPGAVQRCAWLNQIVPEGLFTKKSSSFISLVLTLKENHPDSYFFLELTPSCSVS